jgi:hypothetical protein
MARHLEAAMTPAQIDTVTNAVVNIHAFVSDWWPAITGLALFAGGTWLALRVARFLGQHDTPAAPDNQPGTNTDDLRTCRRINALPTAETVRKEKP